MLTTCTDTTAIVRADEDRPRRSRTEALALFEANRPLVHDYLKRSGLWQHPDAEALSQAGLMGLWAAARRYDESLGWRFSTYASGCIKGFALRELRRSGLIRLPDGVCGAERVGLRERLTPVPLPGERRHGETRELQIPDTRADARAEAGRQAEVRDAVGKALALLSPRQQAVIKLRFLEGWTVKDVARRLGVCAETVRELLREGMRQLRRLAPRLKDLLAA